MREVARTRGCFTAGFWQSRESSPLPASPRTGPKFLTSFATQNPSCVAIPGLQQHVSRKSLKMPRMSRRDFLSTSAAASLLWSSGQACLGGEDESPATGNPYLQGNFAPMREEITADNLKVVGPLPADLDGMFVRNGPNPQFPPQHNYHMFDGDGMLHGVRIRDGP